MFLCFFFFPAFALLSFVSFPHFDVSLVDQKKKKKNK